MRYSAQRYGTWEWLDLEVPFHTDGPEWALSTYGVMYATVAPHLGIQTSADGRLLLEEWGTLIHAESGEGPYFRQWSGIVVRSELKGKEWEVDIWEFPGYYDGTPLETTVWGVFADPAALYRQMITDSQKMPNSDLGITVVGKTSMKIGSDSEDKALAVKKVMDADKAVLDAKNKIKQAATTAQQKQTAANTKANDGLSKEVKSLQDRVNQLVNQKAPANQITAARAAVKTKQDALTARRNAQKPEVDRLKAANDAATKVKEAAQKKYDASKEVYDKAKEKVDEDGGAYKFLAEDTPDIMDSIKTLCDDNELEWTTRTQYSAGKPKMFIDIHHPSAGGTRSDLVFEQGVNVISELYLVRDGEEYANASIGLGAGEGKKAIRGSIASTSKRMRRVTVFDDKKIKKESQLLAAMRKDLNRRSITPYVPEIEVVDHEMARMFSWNVGDHILVSGHVPNYGYFSKMHRIISWKMNGDNKAVLSLELSVN